jgi:hypothetical protein
MYQEQALNALLCEGFTFSMKRKGRGKMLPYQAMESMANQRRDQLRSEAADQRRLGNAGPNGWPFQGIVELARSGYRQIRDAVNKPRLGGPVQPAI